MNSAVMWAVGKALAKGGDDGDVRGFLSKTDLLTRGRARRAFQNEIEAVCIANPEASAGPELLADVAERIGAKATEASAPKWWPTAFASLLLLGTVGLGVAYFATRTEANEESRFETLPERADAYEVGGRPISLGAIGEELFGERFLDFVIALDRHSIDPTSLTEIDLNKAERRLGDVKFKEAVGDEVHAAIVGLAESARVTFEDGESVGGDVDELNRALAAAGLAYFVDEHTVNRGGGTTAILYTYEVERVRIYDFEEGEPERILWLRRLDNLNRQKSATGTSYGEAKISIVRRDRVDDVFFRNVIPLLKPNADARLWPVKPSMPRPPEKDALESRAGEVVRADFEASGVPGDEAAHISTLIAERDDLLARLRSRAKEKGYRLALPTGYLFDVTRYKKLEPVIGTSILPDIETINSKLSEDDSRAVYSALRAAHVNALERYQLQARLDIRFKNTVVPAALTKYLKRGQDGENMSRFGRWLVSRYSSYLAKIALSELPFHTLVQLSEWAFDDAYWNRTNADVAVAVIEGLCATAGIEHADFIANRSVVRTELATAMLKLFALPRPTLKAHAKATWERGFNRPLATPRLRSASLAQ